MAKALDIIIGVDPHKASWTAAAVDGEHHVHGILRVSSSAAGYRELRVFAAQWPGARWAIEGGAGPGRPLAHRLLEEHIDDVVDVPAKLSARVRALGHGHGRKTDAADAVSTAIAARTTATLQRISPEQPAHALRLLSDRRDDLVAARTQTVNRLHAALTALVPGGAPTALTDGKAAERLRTVRPRELVAKTRRAMASDLLADLRRLDDQLKVLDKQITAGVKASATSLPDLYGLGPVLAARILGRIGDITRFSSAGHLASYCGTAPIDVSSGDTVRHRLSRAGDRALSHALHIMAITQARSHAEGRLLPAQTPSREKPQRSAALPETPPVRCDLPPAPARSPPRSDGSGRTFGGDSVIQRGWLNPKHQARTRGGCTSERSGSGEHRPHPRPGGAFVKQVPHEPEPAQGPPITQHG
jgi:transposase